MRKSPVVPLLQVKGRLRLHAFILVLPAEQTSSGQNTGKTRSHTSLMMKLPARVLIVGAPVASPLVRSPTAAGALVC